MALFGFVVALLGPTFGASALDTGGRGGGMVAPRHDPVIAKSSRSNGTPRLVFGIYPGGAAGTVGPSGPAKPEDPAVRLAALEQLRPTGLPFVVRLYASYTGSSGRAADEQVGSQIDEYGRAGFQTELVLCYRPAGGGSPADVGGFSAFVAGALRSLRRVPGFVSVQVTNEANIGGSPNASDGYYAEVEDALINGVIAAKREARKQALSHLAVGFNWAYATDGAQRAFWSYLGRHGGHRFVRELDWVGLDVYPGTWGPALGAGGLAAATTNYIDGALRRLRTGYLPLAGIPRAVSLRVSETGYPTGPDRTDAMQVAVMGASVRAVYGARARYNVTGYRWFDLRDADSSSSSFESQYGLLRDEYSPKPAFGAYRDLVAKLSN